MYNTSYAWGTVNHSEISDKKHAVFEADARTRTSTSTYGHEMAKSHSASFQLPETRATGPITPPLKKNVLHTLIRMTLPLTYSRSNI